MTTDVSTARMWLRKLSCALNAQEAGVKTFEDYYLGYHPKPLVANSETIKEAELAYGRLLRSSITNWVSLVADAPSDRLSVTGFRFSGEVRGDADGWAIWQRNQLDADQALVHDTALQVGNAYALVWRDEDNDDAGDALSQVTIEHPSQMVVAYEAGSRRERAAALKRWIDDDGYLCATVYLPDSIWKFSTSKPLEEVDNKVNGPSYTDDNPTMALMEGMDAKNVSWMPREVPGESWPLPNPLNLVPVVEFRANASLRPAPFGGGVSEFAKVTTIQDRINRTLFGRMITQEFQSFRQRWATGMEPPIDPKTGRAVNPFKPGATQLWMTADEQVKFGEFSEADLSGFLAAAEADVRHMAAITKTPPYYLLGDMVNISADALTASEAGLTNKVVRHQRNFGESWEEVIRLCLAVEGDDRASDTGSSVQWADADQRSIAQTVDAAIKMAQLGVPEEVIWAMLPGVTQQDVARWKLTRDADTWFGREGFGLPGTQSGPVTAPPPPPAA